MSVSSIKENIILKPKEKDKTKKTVPKTFKKFISMQNDNYQKEIFKKLNEGTVLNFIRNSERKESTKSNPTESSKVLKYDLCMINKYDENLNSSLSFISEFDLEEEKEKEDSFNSLDNDNSIEQIDIIEKNNNKIPFDKDDEEYNSKLEKEWEDIQDLLLNKNSS